MERPVNFDRDRLLRCGECRHEWLAGLDWLERWDCSQEACPNCGTNCESETGARVTVDLDEPALDDNLVHQFDWYHTSVSANWPATPDFATHLTDETKLMMGGDEAAARWAERQATKALHLGTYEAAIHNMLRRADSQGGRSAQFYLYRVRVDSTAPIAPGWVIDPSNFVGDVQLDDYVEPGISILRYVNYHEDPGGISLAIRPDVVAAAQQLAIPLDPDADERITETIERLIAVPDDEPPRRRPHHAPNATSERGQVANNVAEQLAAELPVNLRHRLRRTNRSQQGDDPNEWATHAYGIVRLITDPKRTLDALAHQPTRDRESAMPRPT